MKLIRKSDVSFASSLDNPTAKEKLSLQELIRSMRQMIASEMEAANLYEQLADSLDEQVYKDAIDVLRSVAKEEIVHIGEFTKVLIQLNPEEANLIKQGMKENG